MRSRKHAPAWNCACVHAFCKVVNREGICFGSSTFTDAMFASVPCEVFGFRHNGMVGVETVALRPADVCKP